LSAILVSIFSPFDLVCGGKLFQVTSPILLDVMEGQKCESLPLKYAAAIIKKVSHFSVLCTPFLNQSKSTIDLVFAQTEPLIRKARSLLGGEATLHQIRQLKLEAEQPKEAYNAWPETIPQEWTPRSVGVIVSKNDEMS
jgi:hypothetical protein